MLAAEEEHHVWKEHTYEAEESRYLHDDPRVSNHEGTRRTQRWRRGTPQTGLEEVMTPGTDQRGREQRKS